MNFKPSKYDRPVFGKLANAYNLTYYGTIVPDKTTDYIPVRGMTASPEQIDNNYTAGKLSGYGVKLLQRSHDVYLADNRKIYRTWTICQTELQSANLPHLIIEGKDKEANENTMIASYLRMYEINPDSLGYPIAPDFAGKFAVYVSPQDIHSTRRLLTPELQAMLSLHFTDIDFEFDAGNLFVYSLHYPAQLINLDKCLRILIWIAKHVDRTCRD